VPPIIFIFKLPFKTSKVWPYLITSFTFILKKNLAGLFVFLKELVRLVLSIFSKVKFSGH